PPPPPAWNHSSAADPASPEPSGLVHPDSLSFDSAPAASLMHRLQITASGYAGLIHAASSLFSRHIAHLYPGSALLIPDSTTSRYATVRHAPHTMLPWCPSTTGRSSVHSARQKSHSTSLICTLLGSVP